MELIRDIVPDLPPVSATSRPRCWSPRSATRCTSSRRRRWAPMSRPCRPRAAPALRASADRQGSRRLPRRLAEDRPVDPQGLRRAVADRDGAPPARPSRPERFGGRRVSAPPPRLPRSSTPTCVRLLTPPAHDRGDGVVDMQRYMLERLRGEIGKLQDPQTDLLATARGQPVDPGAHPRRDPVAAGRHHARASDRGHHHRPRRSSRGRLGRARLRGARPRGAGPARARAAPVPARPHRPADGRCARRRCCIADAPGDDELFGGAASLVRSQALLRMQLRRDAPLGILAFGARDAEKFHPGQGTELLDFPRARRRAVDPRMARPRVKAAPDAGPPVAIPAGADAARAYATGSMADDRASRLAPHDRRLRPRHRLLLRLPCRPSRRTGRPRRADAAAHRRFPRLAGRAPGGAATSRRRTRARCPCCAISSAGSTASGLGHNPHLARTAHAETAARGAQAAVGAGRGSGGRRRSAISARSPGSRRATRRC